MTEEKRGYLTPLKEVRARTVRVPVDEHAAMIAQLAADRERIGRLTAALRLVQWSGLDSDGWMICPVCCIRVKYGHERHCSVGNALAESAEQSQNCDTEAQQL